MYEKMLANLTDFKIFICLLFFNVAGLFAFANKYLFSDVTFLKWLVVVMVLDLITGITKVWVNEGVKAITSKGLRDSVSKVIQYSCFLIVTHVLTHFQIGNQVNTDFTFLSKMAYQFLILIEIKSVYENIIRINPSLDIITYAANKISSSLKK